jgi:hypothetical protein
MDLAGVDAGDKMLVFVGVIGAAKDPVAMAVTRDHEATTNIRSTTCMNKLFVGRNRMDGLSQASVFD